MKRTPLTDVELRARCAGAKDASYTVAEGTILTPAARDFLRENNITLSYAPAGDGFSTMSRTPIPVKEGHAVYIDAATGRELSGKPEEMTHLRGNELVPKTHPQIAFRGQLDSLMAQIICLQAAAAQAGEDRIVCDLEELLSFTHMLLGAEVKDELLPELRLLGLDSAGIRRASHRVKETFGIDHPIPTYEMGALAAGLNALRTKVRETELAAAHAFCGGSGCTRPDIMEGLNRLSSCVYIIFCRKLSGYYDGKRGGRK